MKTVNKKQVRKYFLLSFISVLLLSISTTSCHKDDDEDCVNVTTGLSGKWTFTLAPDNVYQDTSKVKGMRGTDIPNGPADLEDVYLYENQNGKIDGNFGLLKFSGQRTGNEVQLYVFTAPDGPYDSINDVSQMDTLSVMNLQIDDFGNLKGTGAYVKIPGYDEGNKDTYFVNAKKIADINPLYLNARTNSFESDMCNLSSKISSIAIGYLSGNIFRPIGNCYLEKVGEGYYVFGRLGPGNILPVYTQTIYVPFSWSFSGIRKYHFTIKLKDYLYPPSSIELFVGASAPLYFIANMGYSVDSLFYDDMKSFYSKYGSFAFSLIYDDHNQHVTLYVNHSKGSSWDVLNDKFVKTIQNAFRKSNLGRVYVKSGKEIEDAFYMERGYNIFKNNHLYICYLFGNVSIEYD